MNDDPNGLTLQEKSFELFVSIAVPGWLGSDERWINPTIFYFILKPSLSHFLKLLIFCLFGSYNILQYLKKTKTSHLPSD